MDAACDFAPFSRSCGTNRQCGACDMSNSNTTATITTTTTTTAAAATTTTTTTNNDNDNNNNDMINTLIIVKTLPTVRVVCASLCFHGRPRQLLLSRRRYVWSVMQNTFRLPYTYVRTNGPSLLGLRQFEGHVYIYIYIYIHINVYMYICSMSYYVIRSILYTMILYVVNIYVQAMTLGSEPLALKLCALNLFELTVFNSHWCDILCKLAPILYFMFMVYGIRLVSNVCLDVLFVYLYTLSSDNTWLCVNFYTSNKKTRNT